MSWAVDIRAAMGLWEGLTTNDPVTLEVRPGWLVRGKSRRMG